VRNPHPHHRRLIYIFMSILIEYGIDKQVVPCAMQGTPGQTLLKPAQAVDRISSTPEQSVKRLRHQRVLKRVHGCATTAVQQPYSNRRASAPLRLHGSIIRASVQDSRLQK
jgi:hypothetical protein